MEMNHERSGYFKNYHNLYKRRLRKTFAKAGLVIVNSALDKQKFERQFPKFQDKIIITQGIADENYYPLSWAERENIKIKYAGGREYFIITQCSRNTEELIGILKSFSIFKKKQQSNIQLLLTGVSSSILNEFELKLATFKYRNDVHIYHVAVPQLRKIISASYGYLHPFFPGGTSGILNAFAAGVPVIACDNDHYREIAVDAALYANAGDTESLANQLILLYKDEGLRNSIIEKGNERIRAFSRDEMISELWTALKKLELIKTKH